MPAAATQKFNQQIVGAVDHFRLPVKKEDSGRPR